MHSSQATDTRLNTADNVPKVQSSDTLCDLNLAVTGAQCFLMFTGISLQGEFSNVQVDPFL